MRESPASLDRYRDEELSLETLAEAVGRLLRRIDLRPIDGRIAADVDARGIRYYQTLGILDKPVRYDGRRAVYGYRHLLQLLAVKKLQQEGHPLQLIQRTLAGRPTERLEEAIRALVPGAGGSEDPPHAERHKSEERAATRRHLVAAQVAPGVTLTVDSSVVADPEAVIALIERALADRSDAP